MRYVALLRGINVGGKTKIAMKHLAKAFEEVGMTNVTTYINSGNVLFSSTISSQELTELLEQTIEATFGFAVPVLVRTKPQIDAIVRGVPSEWANDIEQRTDVMFLWNDIDAEGILQLLDVNPDIERVMYIPGAVVWNIRREFVTRGGGIKLIKTDVYKKMTIRNINTVRKLADLL